MSEADFSELLDAAYSAMDGNEVIQDYFRRHGVESRCILTVYTDERAALLAAHLADRVKGKTVVEVGGGLGLLAFGLAEFADHVYVIEASPVWSSIYVQFLHEQKPKNVTFIFGAADEVAGMLHADIALFCTHSDSEGMRQVSSRFAPEVVDVYGEIIEDCEDGINSGMIWAALRAQKARRGPHPMTDAQAAIDDRRSTLPVRAARELARYENGTLAVFDRSTLLGARMRHESYRVLVEVLKAYLAGHRADDGEETA